MQLSLKYMRDRGFHCAITEHFNRSVGRRGVRQDLLGFIDFIALHPRLGTVGVQACLADWHPHVKKLTTEKANNAVRWLEAGNRILLIGWRKVLKEKGKKARVWKPRVREFTLADFPIDPDVLDL